MRIGRLRYVTADDLATIQATAHLGEVIPAWRSGSETCRSPATALREAAGSTQLQLAAASGLTHEAISNLEAGKRAPQASTVRQLAQALGVAPDALRQF